MNRAAIVMAAMSCMAASSVQAQSFNYWPATTRGSGQMLYVPMGTGLTLLSRTQVSTKDSKAGDRIYFTVAETLSYRGQVVIPAGAVAVGEVARSDRNGYLGKKGKIDVNLLYVETPNGPVRLSGGAKNEGTSGLIPSVVTIALVSPLGYFIHGTSAHIPFGTPIKAYLGEDLRFAATGPTDGPAVVATPVAFDRGPLPASFDEAQRMRLVQTAQR